MNDDELLHRDLTDSIIRCYYEVYNELIFGFREYIYRRAMVIALGDAGLAVQSEFPVGIWFRGQRIADESLDQVVNGLVLLEIKAVPTLEKAHEAQILGYLRATKIEVGLLFNFGPKPQFKRFVYRNDRKCFPPESS